jgi:hypothetical protein
MRDYPRGFRNRFFWRRRQAIFDPLAIPPALPVTFVLSCRGGSIALLRLPARPAPSLFPTLAAAIALVGATRTESPLASLQQAAARSWTPATGAAARPTFVRTCRILVRAHGRDSSRKLMPWRGPHSSPGRSRFRCTTDSRVYRRARGRRWFRLCTPLIAFRARWSTTLRAPSLPSNPGSVAPSGAAIMAPSPGPTNNRSRKWNTRKPGRWRHGSGHSCRPRPPGNRPGI